MESIYQLVGETYFENCRTEFDKMNDELIEVYNKELRYLETLFKGKYQGLIKDMESLPDRFYWRKEST